MSKPTDVTDFNLYTFTPKPTTQEIEKRYLKDDLLMSEGSLIEIDTDDYFQFVGILLDRLDAAEAQLAEIAGLVDELSADADELDVEGPKVEPKSKDNGWLHKYELAANATRNARDKLQAIINREKGDG